MSTITYQSSFEETVKNFYALLESIEDLSLQDEREIPKLKAIDFMIRAYKHHYEEEGAKCFLIEVYNRIDALPKDEKRASEAAFILAEKIYQLITLQFLEITREVSSSTRDDKEELLKSLAVYEKMYIFRYSILERDYRQGKICAFGGIHDFLIPKET